MWFPSIAVYATQDGQCLGPERPAAGVLSRITQIFMQKQVCHLGE